MIATDDSDSEEKGKTDENTQKERKKVKRNEKRKVDSEFGVVRGIDFKNVHTVNKTHLNLLLILKGYKKYIRGDIYGFNFK